MVEADPGAREALDDGGRNVVGVAVSPDVEGTPIVHLLQGHADVACDGVGIATLGDMAVLDVPPNRRLRHRILPPHRTTTPVRHF